MPVPPAQLRGRLLARIARRGFEVVADELLIGPLRVPFVRVADPDAVLDRVADAVDRHERQTGTRAPDDAQHLPYWAELWDSAIGLSMRLVDLAPAWGLRDDVRALDLGCGMGLVGSVAAMLGARVTLADIAPDALLFARLNTARLAGRAVVRRVNWQHDRLDERFDLICGADVVYDKSQWEPLERFWRGHLAPGGRVLVGEPGRQTGDGFVRWITGRGWTLTEHAQPAPPRPKPVRIFELTPASA